MGSALNHQRVNSSRRAARGGSSSRPRSPNGCDPRFKPGGGGVASFGGERGRVLFCGACGGPLNLLRRGLVVMLGVCSKCLALAPAETRTAHEAWRRWDAARTDLDAAQRELAAAKDALIARVRAELERRRSGG